MDEPRITETAGTDAELADALTAAGLPIDDLAEPGRRFFRFGDARGLIGFVGWEDFGAVALLRSLAVAPARRRQGWGRALLDWALLRLAEAGVVDVYLLTTGIEPLAAKAGFARIDRDRAPPGIRASRQFAALCPTAAILMHRSLP